MFFKHAPSGFLVLMHTRWPPVACEMVISNPNAGSREVVEG